MTRSIRHSSWARLRPPQAPSLIESGTLPNPEFAFAWALIAVCQENDMHFISEHWEQSCHLPVPRYSMWMAKNLASSKLALPHPYIRPAMPLILQPIFTIQPICHAVQNHRSKQVVTLAMAAKQLAPEVDHRKSIANSRPPLIP
ncbi:unnamed protein product [Soboliphyme baturini]|uniref:Pentatricopeptide repeat-containing protein n=1 Tax=Soboliphyme baturini TaxID=241478 RepID=A0A183IBS4_9BILA|nr:unnamed protein product [Soboliphyme baturini]